jgi:hypothetical protein
MKIECSIFHGGAFFSCDQLMKKRTVFETFYIDSEYSCMDLYVMLLLRRHYLTNVQ